MTNYVTWEIESYTAQYHAYNFSGRFSNYPHINLQSKVLTHGINARITLVFQPNQGGSGVVYLPSYQGSDWDYEYYITLPETQFGTIREFLDSEKPIIFGCYHDTTPIGSSQDVSYWSLRTGSDEPVGEEEDKYGIVLPFRALPEELLSSQAREISEAFTRDLELDQSQPEAS